MPDIQAAPEPRQTAWAALKDVLLCRASRERILALGDRELALGTLLCWLAGMGRWWDLPTASLAQKLGLGSVAYPFVLGTGIWLFFWPWRMPQWRLKPLIAYIALTGALGIVYALPVEMIGPQAGALYNVAALLVVSAWRVRLLYRYLRVVGLLSSGPATAATLLPISCIMFAITFLNLASGVIEGMGGFRGPQREAISTGITLVATVLLVYPFPVLLLFYLGYAGKRWRDRSAAVTQG